MSVCAVCGSSDFGDPRDGLFFCLECGTQSQDVRVEISQLEDGGSRFTRTLRTKKGKSKKEERQETGHVLGTFQQVIKRQCDALIALGFDPSLKEAARLIWFTYLRHYGYAFREEGQSVSGRPRGKRCQLLSSQPTPSGSVSLRECGANEAMAPDGRRRRRKRGQKRQAITDSEGSSAIVKKARRTTKEAAGYDTFPDDKFLFETRDSSQDTEEDGKSGGGGEAESVKIMEGLSSWEELEELERAMDCRQLLAFRQGYLVARGIKPQFVADDESWAGQPRVFKMRMTVSVLYLALLYTEQPLLPVDLVRWVRREEVPLNAPLGESGGYGNTGRSVFFTTTRTVTTAVVIENAFRLYLHLPLPPIASPDPRAISHIIIDRLRLTDCFKRLVDRALGTVYLPVGFTQAIRMDSECAAVIIMMLRILYGLDDHTELETPPAGWSEIATDGGGGLTSANSLPVWVDWVQLYCTQVSSASPLEEDVPVNHLELSKTGNRQDYLQFCRETVFTKCRPTPTGAKSFRAFDPAFSKKISSIFGGVCKAKPATDSLLQSLVESSSPPPSPDPSTAAEGFPRLVHLSHFVRSPTAPSSTYRPLPTSHHSQEELDKTQLSHATRFLLSALCEIIDATPSTLYTVLLAVEKSFTKGTVVTLRNLTHDFLSK